MIVKKLGNWKISNRVPNRERFNDHPLWSTLQVRWKQCASTIVDEDMVYPMLKNIDVKRQNEINELIVI